KSVFLPTDDLTALGAVPEFFELKLEVGRHGQAEGIRMVASSDPMLNKPVLKAVRQFRWSPARLDHHNIPVPVNLTVLVND
ncbi:MAG: energy transducer TonB, partial [Terracidiphilus sp.]